MEFWQNIVLKWKQIQQFCLWALSSDPSGLVESGLYYNTTANRAALRDDTKTQFLAHLEDTYKNAGVVKQPTITKGAGSVTVGNDAVIRCYKTTDYSGIIQEVVNPVGGTFALTENTELWLVYTYGVGYSVQTSITGPLSNTIPVYRFFNAFGVIHSSTQDEMGVGATEKILVKQTRTEYIKRVGDSGIELSTSALNVLISGGLAYNGPILETILPFNSATNNLYRVVYDDGVWSQTTLHALTNTHYNPSTGLAALNSNKYCWAYVWRSIGNDVEALFQLGEQEYATEAQAVADIGRMPANIYGLYATHCVLVGYVLIKQGVTTTKYFSAWGRPTVAGAPVYHNTLAGLDAGDPGTAYFGHVKLLDNSRMNAAGDANGYALLGADGKLPSGQLPSYVDDVLEYDGRLVFPATGENGKIYVDLATNLTWRWSGTTYVEISPSLALGETSATAYRGDRGKTAYDHSQLTASNPHGTTASQITSTATGDISATNVQAAIAELASEKLAAATAATTYAPINTTLADNAASSTLPTTASGSLVSKIQQVRDYLKYLIAQISGAQAELDNKVTHYSVGYNASSVGYFWCNIGSVYLETGKYNSILLDYHGSFFGTQHWSYGLIFIQLNTGSTYPSIKLTKINTDSNATSLVSLFGDWNATNGILTLWGAFVGGNGGGNIQCNLLSRSVPTATFSAYGGWQSAEPTWTYLIPAAKQELTDVAPINATLTNESGQDVLPTGTYAITAILQWFRNNLSQLFTAVAGKAPTSHASTGATYGVADAYYYSHAKASSEAPLMNGTASVGDDNGKYAREGHVHPTDTSRAPASMTVDPIIGGSAINYDGTGSIVWFIECHYSNIKYLLSEIVKKATRATSNVVALSSGTTLSTVSNGTTYTLVAGGSVTISPSAGSVGDRIFFTSTGCSSGTITVNGISKSGQDGRFGIIAEKCALGWCVC